MQTRNLFGEPTTLLNHVWVLNTRSRNISAAVTSGFINQWFRFAMGLNMTEYLLNMQKTHKLHVEDVQERHFLRIKKAMPNDAEGEVCGQWGIEGILRYKEGECMHENLQI